jgi:hypothetical protein
MRRAARLVLPGLSALLCAAILTGTQSARASDDDKKKPQYGMFNVGFHVEAGAGVYQVLGQGGMVPGIYPRVAVEMHLGPHFSIPVVGARIGKFTASRELVDFEQTNDPGAQEVAGFPVAPEATVKIEWWIASPFALKAGVTYAPVFVQGVPIHNIEESIAAALVF